MVSPFIPMAGLSAVVASDHGAYRASMSKAAPILRPAPIRLRSRGCNAARWALVALELMAGAAAVAGGVLLAAAPDGSLLRADPAVLAGTPFNDWRVPGLLLAALVGGGYLLTGWWQWAGRWHARGLSIFAGAGLVAFEAAELAWIGFQPLEAICAGIGVTVIVLAWRTRTSQQAPDCERTEGGGNGYPA